MPKAELANLRPWTIGAVACRYCAWWHFADADGQIDGACAAERKARGPKGRWKLIRRPEKARKFMAETKQVRVAPCNPPGPTNICFEAWVDGEEERYGTAYGTSRDDAIRNIEEAIEMVDDDGKQARVEVIG